MDPNEALKQIRAAVAVLMRDPQDLDHGYDEREQERRGDAADSLAEHAVALDGWLTNGGFLPDVWEQGGHEK